MGDEWDIAPPKSNLMCHQLHPTNHHRLFIYLIWAFICFRNLGEIDN